MVALGGLNGDTRPGTAGPRSKVVLHSYLPRKGTHESGEEAARQRIVLDGVWTALDGWLGSQGIVHSNKETSGKFALWQGGAHGARRLQPT